MVERPLVRAAQVAVLDLIRQVFERIHACQDLGARLEPFIRPRPVKLGHCPGERSSIAIAASLCPGPAEDEGRALGREDALIAAIPTAVAGGPARVNTLQCDN